ncbi:MAG: hypothetical protein WA058_00390 [Minisyncoccia bacterium]
MNIFTAIGSFFRQLRSGAYLDPVRDWLVLLTLSTIALVSIIVWNVWAFDTVATGGSIGAPTSVTPAAFDRASLDVIHTIFTNRAAEETKYATGAYTYTDPSQ